MEWEGREEENKERPRPSSNTRRRLSVFEDLTRGTFSKEGWSRDMVETQRLFFNTWYKGNTKLAGRSTREVEKEAVQWAGKGLTEIKNLLTREGKLILEVVFQRKYPDLSVETYRNIKTEMRGAWHAVLGDSRRMSAEEGYTTYTTITPTKMLVAKEPMRLKEREGGDRHTPELGVGDIYDTMIAGRWSMPRTFQTGHKGQMRWAEKQRDPGKYGNDIQKIYGALRHPGVPRWMSDTVHRMAADTEIVGDRLSKGARTFCKRCKSLETISHKYGSCRQTVKAWSTMLEKWKQMTGESLSPTDEWVTIWGVRWGDTEGRVKGSGEEVFRAIHASMVVAIHEESAKKRPGGAGRIYQRACALVQQLAANNRHHRGKAFGEEWVGTGIAMPVGKQAVRILWGGKETLQAEECQDEGPLIEVYTDGSARKGKAGWGMVVVMEGEEFECRKGPVEGTAKTNNVGEVMGVQHAIR